MRIGDFMPLHVEKLKADMLKDGFVPVTSPDSEPRKTRAPSMNSKGSG
jgi:hypothetical protein